MAEKKHFRVGEVVRFLMGVNKVEGVIKEDRGPIGVGGRRLYSIQFTLDPDFQAVIELPAKDLELVNNTATAH
ncbi:MAG: hypothetical protein L0Y72_19570 [Gemmataceae bacterium]|nr:hypothetical protein [Gemmataceae bacterium]MCI0741236.1 hypothetical protein [Gemmataceae bacterium]